MIVADANLLAYLVWLGDLTEPAAEVLAHDPMWQVPTLWISELRSVFGAHLRAGRCTLAEAAAALERAERVVAGRERTVDSRTVLDLAATSGCTTYDCEYVALALSLGVTLVTSDRQVLRAFPSVAVAPKAFIQQRGA
jgi:predicted nucleic acid-binding protein